LNILFSSAGRRVGLIECFRDSARDLGIPLSVIAVDAEPALSAACRAADRSHRVPRCDAPDFLAAMRRVAELEGIDIVIPTIDTELAFLSKGRAALGPGLTVLISSPEVVGICRDKLKTAEFLAAAGVPAPGTVAARDFPERAGGMRPPFIVKPIDGSSSKGMRRISEADEFAQLELDPDRHIVQELCDGPEYTVNIFLDRNGRLRAAVPHRRIEIREGEVSKGVTERHPALLAAAEAIAARLGALGGRGPLCFQAILDERGRAVVFEINARFGGGYPLAHRAGAHFCRWILEERLGRPPSWDPPWREGLTMLRYDAAVFLEA